ncbi:hypothetical protein ETAA8_14840 [Anatilimnocola aggregata]|uniref:Uncharacterized protein n=1 Tax=Anatilimnocola aggregata TaxID=2528021 RepID=A0A517Y852_9BACT|nr:hypothetical protein [Anatilimnocola aggregata]QDU26406.1 hypothetical protein ETAA8_14840 [Anatilimnocola aggregata]
MKRPGWELAVAVLMAAGLVTTGAVGCGKSNAVPPTLETSGVQPGQAIAAAPAKEVPADAAPDQVVTVFLDAMRAGDAATTAALLTAKAREETAKHELPVAPNAAPNAQFQVAPAQYLQNNPNGAHVQARWVEVYGDETITNEVIWVLRKQPDGWRVAGFAIELVPGQGPQFLNFEDPLDMMNKHKEALAAAEAEEARVAAQAAAQTGVAQGTQPGIAPIDQPGTLPAGQPGTLPAAPGAFPAEPTQQATQPASPEGTIFK